jgi:hypothetical protein
MGQKFGHFPLLLKPHPQRGQITLLICRIVLEKLQALGKQFHWKKPECCPECGSIRLWGHGFVLRQFVGFAQGLWMKRYRCPDCHAVHTCRPEQFLPGMQYPVQTQKSSLEAKLAGKPFLQAVPRQIQQHWWKAFLTRCREAGNWSDPLNFLCQWTGFGQLPVTIRRIYRESWPTVGTPYLCFALTVKKRPFSLE